MSKVTMEVPEGISGVLHLPSGSQYYITGKTLSVSEEDAQVLERQGWKRYGQ